MMIMPQTEPDQIERIRASFRLLSAHAEDLTRIFFTRLFTAGPGVRALFPRDIVAESMGTPGASGGDRAQDFIASLGIIIKNMHRLESIEHLLLDMGARAQRAGAQPQHFGMVRDALVSAMRDVLGPGWTPQLQNDWTQMLNVVAAVMIRGAGQARRAA